MMRHCHSLTTGRDGRLRINGGPSIALLSMPICLPCLICLLPLTAALSLRASHCIPFAANAVHVCRHASVSPLLTVLVLSITSIGEDMMEAQVYPSRINQDLLAIRFTQAEPLSDADAAQQADNFPMQLPASLKPAPTVHGMTMLGRCRKWYTSRLGIWRNDILSCGIYHQAQAVSSSADTIMLTSNSSCSQLLETSLFRGLLMRVSLFKTIPH